MIARGCLIILSVVLLVLQGCVAVQTFPTIARANDTVTLALGSQDGMTKENTQVFFLSDSPDSQQVPVTNIRSIFKLYADKTSDIYNHNSQIMQNLFNYQNHEQWLTIMVLDLPPSLPVGTGVLSITTTAAQTQGLADVNAILVKLEIVEGIGNSNSFNYYLTTGIVSGGGGLEQLEPGNQLIVKPPESDTGGWPSYAVIEIKILPQLYNPYNITNITENNFNIIPQDVSYRTKSKKSVISSYRNNELIVSFLSSNGRLKYFEPRFSVVAISPIIGIDNVQQNITSIRYFDINGNIVPGPPVAEYSTQVIPGPN